MNSNILTTPRELESLCEVLAQSPAIAFDTEFVSEHTYRPQLCLVQVATRDTLVAIDAIAIRDLAPFWKVLAEGQHETVVHAGREELGFSLDSVQARPANLIDIQIASGLVGLEYPAGYGTLTQRLIGRSMAKGETRSDWRKRPLSRQQVAYALDDVRYLLQMRDVLVEKLDRLQRRAWLVEEMEKWQSDVEESRQRERWRSISGSGSLYGRPLSVLRELWRWRENEAQLRNCPPRRILRDDLLVELAKRQVTDPKEVCSIRGMERMALRQAVPDLVAAVERGIATPEEPSTRHFRQSTPPQLTMLGQFLSSALSSICQDNEVAASLVGNPSDVRDLITYKLNGETAEEPPRLTTGWRAELVGGLLTDLLQGRVTIRISNPKAEQPLSFETRSANDARDPALEHG